MRSATQTQVKLIFPDEIFFSILLFRHLYAIFLNNKPLSAYHSSKHFYLQEKLLTQIDIYRSNTKVYELQIINQVNKMQIVLHKRPTANEPTLLQINNQAIVNQNPQRTQHQEQQHQEQHNDAGELLKSIIYGGLDGSTAIIIIILSGISSGTDANKILSITIAALIGDAIGMGLGDYLSAKAQIEFIAKEKERELYEVENMMEEEMKEVIEIYTRIDESTNLPKYCKEDATRIAELYATNRQAFVKIMLLQELGLVEIDPIMAKKCGVATFISFALFGFVPALPYVVSAGIMKQKDHEWIPVIALGVIELFSLGLGKAALIGLNKWKSGLQTLLFGVAISAIGFGLGYAFPS